MPVVRELKSWPAEFAAVRSGDKAFEIRRDDRDPAFERGDLVLLREWLPTSQRYSGEQVTVEIGYVERSACLPAGWCGFAVRLC